MVSRDRQGNELSTFDDQAGAVQFLYTTRFGRFVLKILVRPWVSKTVGWVLNRRVSAPFARSFAKKNGIDLSQYEGAPYRSFNAFFCRPIRPEYRPFDEDPARLVAPCDSKLSAYPISEDSRFAIKGTEYTVQSLLRDEELAQKYTGGWLLLFRLAVDDYHRYAFPAEGEVTAPRRIPGVFHTVNPAAAALRPIYKENTREYVTLSTAQFGDLLQMEVGAMLVGRIVNESLTGHVCRGQEKGHFEFGGSTVILCVQPGHFTPDADVLTNTAEGFETIVKMGEGIGYAGTEVV